jgi:hypothetical protein
MLEYFLGIAKTSQIASGLKDGFYAAGGPEAFRSIIQNVFKALFKAIVEIFKVAPLEFSIIGSAALLIPAFVSSFSIVLANWLEGALDGALVQFGKRFKTPTPSEAKALLDLQKAAPKITTSGGAVVRQQAVTSAAFRAMAETPIQNADFPVALGMERGVGGVTGPYRAPSVPKPIKGSPGFKWLSGKEVGVKIDSVAKNAFKGVKGAYAEGGIMTRLGAGGMAGLKNPLGMLKGFGGALTVLSGVINGITTLFSGGDVWKSLGATAGPIIGTIIGTAIAGPFGAFIGGWIGSLEPVSQTLGEIFKNVGESLMGMVDTLAKFGGALLDAIGGLTGAKNDMQALQQILVLLKIALFPLTATLQLLDMGARALYIVFLQFDKWFNATFQWGDRQGRIQAKIDEAQSDQLNRLYENHEYYVAMSRGEGTKAVLGGKNVTWKGGKWVGEDGKPVGNAAPAPTKPSPIFTPGGTPNPVNVPGATPPQAAVPEEVKQTATNIQEINTKAAQQVTQGAAVQKSTDETKKNTATANTTLGNIKAGVISVSNKLSSLQTAMLGDLNNIQAGVASISSLLSSGQLKVTGCGPGGGPMGTAKGDLGRAQNLAGQYGLSLTSHFRPGDKGYHGLGRAMDFSNGVSTPQQMEFAQAMVAQYGTTLKELIYTPLGFGIKDGTRVPLSYWGAATNAAHYNHVHVAFANGLQDGRMFTNQSAAGGWENSMVPGSVKVASITGNSAESFGGSNFGDINVTVNAGGVNDPDELASLVALRIGEAVADARASSIFV